MKKIKIIRNYIVCAGILLLLICSAFVLPTLFFQMGDEYRENTYVLEKGEKADISTLNLSYEKKDYDRLANFAEGLAQGKKYYVTVEDYQNSSEIHKVVQDMFYNNIMLDNWIYNYYFPVEASASGYFTITTSKRYVVYDEDVSQGVQFLLWYVELSFPGETTVQIVVDEDTKLVYYCEVIYDRSMQDAYLEDIYEGGNLFSTYEMYKQNPMWIFSTVSYAGFYYGIEKYEAIQHFQEVYYPWQSFGEEEWLVEDSYYSQKTKQQIATLLEEYDAFKEHHSDLAETRYPLYFGNEKLDWVNMLYTEEVNEQSRYRFYIGLQEVKNLLQETH